MFQNSKISITSIATFFLLYASITGSLWHLGYWSCFKFNFFEFANVSDLFKSAMYPFLSNIWFFIVVLFFAGGLSISNDLAYRHRAKNGNLESTKDSEITLPYLMLLFFLSSGTIFLFSGLLFRLDNQWIISAFGFALFVACVFYSLNVLKSQVKNGTSRLLILFTVLLVPALNFGIAKYQGMQIKYGVKYKQVVGVISNDSTVFSKVTNSAYLGAANNYYFFYKNKNVIIVQSNAMLSFELKEVVTRK